MAAERIIQLKESGIECSIDQHTINIRIGPAKKGQQTGLLQQYRSSQYLLLKRIKDMIIITSS